MAKLSVRIVVPSYNGVLRCTALLRSIARFDQHIFQSAPITVFEDPCGEPGVALAYDRLRRFFPVDVCHLPTWSNMHGAAQYAVSHTRADWVVYLGDDVLVTRGALSNLVDFIRAHDPQTVALIQPAYWNAHDLSEDHEGLREYPGPALLRTKQDMYTIGLEWLEDVPNNPHWSPLRPYVNVNGVGFAIHRDTWEAVGGFAEQTWCLDESISVRVWTRSERGIICLPGPPLVHFFAGAQTSNPPQHDLYTEEAWIRGMKMTKAEASVVSYEKMAERTDRILNELADAYQH